jgi:hypothetical protein
MPVRSSRPAAAKDAPDAPAPPPAWASELGEGDLARAGPTTQVSLFPASELEPAPLRPRRRLARLKSLLLAFDARRKDVRRVVTPDARRDPLRLRTNLWLDSFFDR